MKVFVSLISLFSLPVFFNEINAAENYFESNYSQSKVFKVKSKFPKYFFLNNSNKETKKISKSIASLRHEYQRQVDKNQADINNCSYLKKYEISFVNEGKYWPHNKYEYIAGLTVRTGNFSLYRFKSLYEQGKFMGQSCREVGKFEFNKIYKIGGKQVEFFKQSHKSYPVKVKIYRPGESKWHPFKHPDKFDTEYINEELVTDKFEIKAYLKGNNGPVRIINLFDVGTNGILSLPLYEESYKNFFNW